MRRNMVVSLLFLLASTALADVPQTINHQGVVKVNGQPFNGTGRFKFAILNAAGVNVWTNDNSNLVLNGVPNTFEDATVIDGVYSVILGGTGPGYTMTPIAPAVFNEPERRLRIWFDDGTNGVQQLTPDHSLTSTPYAQLADVVSKLYIPGTSSPAVVVDNNGFISMGTNHSIRVNDDISFGTTPPANTQVYISPQDPNSTGLKKSFWINSAVAIPDTDSVATISSTLQSAQSTVLKVIGDSDADSGGPYVFRVSSTGIGSGTYGQYWGPSDERLKTDIITIPNALDRVTKLRGVNFKWRDPSMGKSLRIGLISQEVEEIFPEAVHTSDDKDHTKSVEYQYLVGALVEAIKDLNCKIDTLSAEVEQLKMEPARLHESRRIVAVQPAGPKLVP